MTEKLTYIPKLITALGFIVLLIVFVILFLGRNSEAMRLTAILNMDPQFYTHVSNLCISYLIYAASGYMWLMMGIKFTYINILGIVMILCNFIYELYISVLNTPDIIDAYYGLAGTLIAFLFLVLTKNFGLKPNPLKQI